MRVGLENKSWVRNERDFAVSLRCLPARFGLDTQFLVGDTSPRITIGTWGHQSRSFTVPNLFARSSWSDGRGSRKRESIDLRRHVLLEARVALRDRNNHQPNPCKARTQQHEERFDTVRSPITYNPSALPAEFLASVALLLRQQIRPRCTPLVSRDARDADTSRWETFATRRIVQDSVDTTHSLQRSLTNGQALRRFAHLGRGLIS